MPMKYAEYKGLDLPKVADEVRSWWKENQVFEKSVSERAGKETFVFYEGPPSANGMPGIHHVMARAIKDLFCRYKTQKGYQVQRKAGWDTHGLPVELGVEKELGITKEDIGQKISIADYNKACKEAVMRYTDTWNELTRQMGYWVDMDDPYITYKSKYMETVWWLLKRLHDNNMIYKGYTIQPYSPAAGTGLSSHELNMPGCYRPVKDATVTAMFKIREESEEQLRAVFPDIQTPVHLLAWTTTPWTLPSNTALAVGPKIDYVVVESFNQYSGNPIRVIMAKALVESVLGKKYREADPEALHEYQQGDKKIPFAVVGRCKGEDLAGIRYEQLLPYTTPADGEKNAFQVIRGDFVTTEDGTGVVHIAPTFGADDMQVAKDAGVPPMVVEDKDGRRVPLVDLQGRFIESVKDDVFGLGGEYVKPEYLSEEEKKEALENQRKKLGHIITQLDEYLSVDERIGLKLKLEDKAFKIEKYEHSYPHCWRTDKPVLYYPLDSWFIKASEARDRMIELNNTINWKPASTGTGRFGNWLENLNDWNLSRSRYWGIPLPIWRTGEGDETKCIGSVEELKAECENAVSAGVMKSNPLAGFEPGNMSEENYEKVDLHKHHVDDIVLASSSGKPMHREADLIDVWFDSGSMPYAQWHYPFENKEMVDTGKAFPADFIAEGVDQTRGWFYTLHAIATMCFDSVAYKNVVSNGLVLDKNGQKMSKRLGNAVDPFKTIEEYGPDATRWYMITNAQPWDNLKFDLAGVKEVQRKFFGTLYNTYSFFTLYANIDGFSYEEDEIPLEERPEIDRWIISLLNSLILDVDDAYDRYEPTRAGRLIQEFTTEHLSNWYVRLSRRRFWKGDYNKEKIAAYQTLYRCLEVIAQLSAPIAPFYAERLFNDLNSISGRHKEESVHIAPFPVARDNHIDKELESKMDIAQRTASLVLGLRKKEQIKVRQPLNKVVIPVYSEVFRSRLDAVSDLILTEVNVKQMEYLSEDDNMLVKRIKPDFKRLGPRFGKWMKQIARKVSELEQSDIRKLESDGELTLDLGSEQITLEREDFEITTQDIPGWLVASDGYLTVALDITVTDDLRDEGIAREMVNRIQNLRKDSGFDVTDKIALKVLEHDNLNRAVQNNLEYICAETLAGSLDLVPDLNMDNAVPVEVEDGITTRVLIEKMD